MEKDFFFTAFDMILAVVVLYALFSFVSGVGKETIFEKNYLSRDVAIMLDTISAAPGDVSYKYTENVGDFAFDINQNAVLVKGKGQPTSEGPWGVQYPFAENKELPVQPFKKEGDAVYLYFTKSRDGITTTEGK